MSIPDPARSDSAPTECADHRQSTLQIQNPAADVTAMKLRPANRLLAMSLLAVFFLAFAGPALATTPLAGEKGNYRGQCRQLTKQIKHYNKTILPLARARGNQDWERATTDQVKRLWNRRADLCPAYGRQRTLLAKTAEKIREFNELVSLAARGALAFFTGGLSGGLAP